MKAIRVFLLILIIVGIILIFTQNTWVPILVNKIISSENAKQEILKSKTPPINTISITAQKINELRIMKLISARNIPKMIKQNQS